jgi:hypothetical protein
MYMILRTILAKAAPSWTVWASVALAVATGLPDVLSTVVGWFGPVTPELSARVVALALLATRMRSIVTPVLKDLLGK